MKFDILKNGKIIATLNTTNLQIRLDLLKLGYELRLSNNLLDKVQLI